MRNWLSARPITHMITLQPNRDACSPTFLKDRLRRWDARINRLLLGPKWERKPDRRLVWFAFPEKLASKPHWHLLIELTAKHEARLTAGRFDLQEAVDRHWVKLVPGGSADTKPVTDPAGAARYCTKLLQIPENYDLFTLSRVL